MNKINQKLRQELLSLAKKDLETRDRLAKDGSLFGGYNLEMEKVHKHNAAKLKALIKKYGWPGKSLVGEDGADAAWLIYQHDIGKPRFIRACLPALKKAFKKGELSGKNLARTIDRILVYEGKPQIYGTNYDWDEHGKFNPYPIADEKNVDKLRKGMGLPLLKKDIAEKRREIKKRGEKPPKNYQEYKAKAEKWFRSVGWR